jgi:8-oxo-dGTP pyrophosphatase MutT (NUDIX family)
MHDHNSDEWKTISSETVFKGKRLTVLHDKVLLPNGQEGEYEYIQKKDFLLVIPATDTSFFLVEQYRYPVKKRMLEFPQGASHENEPAELAASRELKEETGLTAEKFIFLGRIDMGKGSSTQGCNVFLAQDLKQGENNLDNTEQDLIVNETSKNDMQAMIKRGKITDSATLSAYLLFLSLHWN